jgi:hypothetical protein
MESINLLMSYNGCSFKFGVEVRVEKDCERTTGLQI